MPVKPSQRPVECWVCGRQMHYIGEPWHEPEFKIEIIEHSLPVLEGYAHKACVNRIVGEFFVGRPSSDNRRNA